MPIVVIVVGAGICVLGMMMESTFVTSTGAVVIVSGVLWGFLTYGSVFED